jgi:pimeloyl-ACP methyl ester carboxylesterase
VDTDSISDRLIRRPVYRVVNRCLWVGVRHTTLYDQILALAETWRVWRVVVDGTGVGAGLASFLAQALPGRLETFIFTAASKGQLGWAFMGLVECGRFKDWHRSTGARGDEGGWQEEFYQQVGACQMEVLPGPERRLRWGVPDGRRDERTGELLHDDLVFLPPWHPCWIKPAGQLAAKARSSSRPKTPSGIWILDTRTRMEVDPGCFLSASTTGLSR